MRKAIKILCFTLVIFFLICTVFMDSIYARTISWGTRGNDVREVQQKLRNWGYYRGSVDGIFGQQTYRAVVDFQRKNGLKADGIVGAQTKRALGITTPTPAARGGTAQVNETVRIAQQKLKQWSYYKGAVDGIYGNLTGQAIRDFQRKNGLTVDGVIGPQTRRALGMPTGAQTAYTPTSRGVTRNDDLRLMAMAINGEARGEPYTGQVAVGAVILNRVRHPSFPNTIAGVIYEPLAFTAVADKQIYLEPNESAYRAARDALNGWDPTGGAIYYWNPVTATSKWIWTREPSVKIGKHWFAHR
ncbi:MAG: spore cortex-lytic enzyme [Thermotaleaceae bacterium]